VGRGEEGAVLDLPRRFSGFVKVVNGKDELARGYLHLDEGGREPGEFAGRRFWLCRNRAPSRGSQGGVEGGCFQEGRAEITRARVFRCGRRGRRGVQGKVVVIPVPQDGIRNQVKRSHAHANEGHMISEPVCEVRL